MSVYNDYEWLPWRFTIVHKSTWEDVNNVNKYMKWLENKLNIKKPEDWYNISIKVSKNFLRIFLTIFEDLKNNHGESLLYYYDNSFVKLLSSVYPDFNWLPWKFITPTEYWNDKNNIKKYINWLTEQLNIKSMEDWYSVSVQVSIKIFFFIYRI